MDHPTEIDVVTAARLHAAGACLLDVREPGELATVAVAGARHIPMREIPARMGELPTDRQVLVLCHHGGRSGRVTRFLRANGFLHATNVAGGIDAWALQVDPSLPRY
jgi:adenylyltransferase/sulfurtransferase